LPLLLNACGGTTAPQPASGPGSPTSAKPSAAAASAKLKLPTLMPAVSAKPDLPADQPGLQAGYTSYPKDLIQSVKEPPGKGGDVTAYAQSTGTAVPSLDQNAGWQAVNKALNVNLKGQFVNATDYPKLAAVLMAGNDLPDLFSLNHTLT